MSINADLFIHESDRAALNALKSVPGFTQVIKAFMSVFNENAYRIMNMSTHIRLGENQLPQYYNMLKPICEKLEIEVPELYLEMNVTPNAYTSGDTKPFIVLTSGLLETLPEELIPTVLAHECGHIVCHHVLYQTMGKMILNGAINALGIPNIAVMPIQAAFMYWMRCAEYSADRCAMVVDGTPLKIAEVCARLAGFSKKIDGEINMEAFLAQAIEYRKMMENDRWNKTLETLIIMNNSHPLNAVRAYECVQFGTNDQYFRIVKYINHISDEIPLNNKSHIGQNVNDVKETLQNEGFTNITLERVYEKDSLFIKEGQVVDVLYKAVDDQGWLDKTSPIVIYYYSPLTDVEIIERNPNMTKIGYSHKELSGKSYVEVKAMLTMKGFKHITCKGQNDITRSNDRNLYKVIIVSIDNKTVFTKDTWADENSEVVIYYHEMA